MVAAQLSPKSSTPLIPIGDGLVVVLPKKKKNQNPKKLGQVVNGISISTYNKQGYLILFSY